MVPAVTFQGKQGSPPWKAELVETLHFSAHLKENWKSEHKEPQTSSQPQANRHLDLTGLLATSVDVQTSSPVHSQRVGDSPNRWFPTPTEV